MSGPDFIAPFVGWKGLHANQSGQLFSPQNRDDALWPPGAAFEARCSAHPEHQPPDPRCSCGVYAVKSFEALERAGYNWAAEYHDADRGDCLAVVAEIKLWGRIRRGTIGYKGEFAYPLRVYVPAWRLALGGVIRRRYGCALGIIDRFSGQRKEIG